MSTRMPTAGRSAPARGLLVCALVFAVRAGAAPAPEGAPYVDAKAIRERFDAIAPAELEALRTKRILLASRSFGLNLCDGLRALAAKDPRYDLLSSYRRYDVFKAGSDLGIVPPDAFGQARFVHVLATYWPHTKRVEEVDRLLREPPHRFGAGVDAVVIFFHTAVPAAFDEYAAKMDALQADFPEVRFVYVTAGFMGPKYAKENENAHAFGEKVRARYRGRAPLYDMGAILSDDFRAGHVFCPEYSRDPAQVHPDHPDGEAALARGFLLVLCEAFRAPAGPPAAGPALPPRAPAAPAAAAPALPPHHPDARAVRAILDANGLVTKKVEGVSVVENGRIVALYLQEGGIAQLPDAIGQLGELRVLHLYGDRALPHPLLRRVSPAIGRCAKLEELLLNQNDLATLPVEIAGLANLKRLSIADNRLADLPPAVAEWARRLDPEGLARQGAGAPAGVR